MELRYEGWLETSISSQPDLLEALVPNLILQPLAENALTHGVGRAGGVGFIRAEARREGESLVLTVLDSGPGNAKERQEAGHRPRRGGGFGLQHTRERLQELYGSSQSLTLTPDPVGGMIAEIRIPYHTEAISSFPGIEVIKVGEPRYEMKVMS